MFLYTLRVVIIGTAMRMRSLRHVPPGMPCLCPIGAGSAPARARSQRPLQSPIHPRNPAPALQHESDLIELYQTTLALTKVVSSRRRPPPQVDKGWSARAARPFDPRLTELGESQARAAAAELKQYDLKRVVVSPFLRYGFRA